MAIVAGPGRVERGLGDRPMKTGLNPTQSHGGRTLYLRLGVDGDALVATLTDDGALLLVGELPGLARRCAALEDLWTCAAADAVPAATASDERAAVHQLESFGTALFNTLLPDRIQSFLRSTAPGALQLAVDPQLAGIPWECAHDGRHHWQQSHQVERLALAQRLRRPARDHGRTLNNPLLLLCSGGTGSGTQRYCAQLQTLLEQLSGRPVWLKQHVPTTGAVDESGVIHYVGSVDRLLQEMDNNHDLTRWFAAARHVVLDLAPDIGTSPTWQSAGTAISRALGSGASLAVIQRANDLHGSTLVAQRYYQSLAEPSPRPAAWLPPAPMTAVVSRYGPAPDGLFASPAHVAAERSFRQVTALSYDLVGSTQLMHSLGMEQYSLKLLEYHRRFARVVERCGGLSDQPQGNDGVMCYFGVHHVHEDTVCAAVQAGLQLLDVAGQMELRIRIGMATGQVAVNTDQLVGVCVHLAARIQSLAPVGTILASAATAELAQPHFDFEPFVHDQVLKGFADNPRVFKLGSTRPPAVLQLAGSDQTAALVGRAQETAQLEDHWRRVRQGKARWVHVTGEAGIGKSRLVAQFAQRVAQQAHHRAYVCRCYSQSAGRAFGPIIELLERLYGIQSTDDVPTRQEKLARSIAESGITPYDHLAIRYLLGLPTQDSRNPNLQLAHEPRRRFVLRTMASWLINQAHNDPVCLVFEDLQWADPSTLQYLQQLRTDSQDCALLVLLTQRSSNVHPTSELADYALALGRLDDLAVHAMIDGLVGQHLLGSRERELIADKSDGVPLFIEMSTHMVLESRTVSAVAGEAGSASAALIPVKLRDLLMQRLDNLGPARQLAQLCSVIGREFPRAMLLSMCDARVAAIPAGRLQTYLATLLGSGMLLGKGGTATDHVQYHFRHALVHEVAYQSMWETDRRSLHRAIAQAIEAHMPDVATAQPELLAHHYQASGMLEQGAKWHWLAARKYKAQEAHTESLNHLDLAKALLLQLPANAQRHRSELEIELTKAGQLIATRGYGSAGAGHSYLAALALAKDLNDKKSVLRAQLGLEAYHLMRADFGQAHAYLAQAHHTALEFDDPLTRAGCLFALANVLHHQGHGQAMLEHSDQCLQVCRQSALRGKLVQSPEVMSLMYSAVSMWEMGLVDQSRQRAREGVEIAERLGQRLGLGQALGMLAMILHWCGELEQATEASARAIAICQAGEHDMWTAHAQLMHGSCLSEQGDPKQGLALMDAGYTLWESTGTIVTRTFYLALRCAACIALGRTAQALALIDEAARIVREHGERYYEPEVLRIRGEALLLDAAQRGVEAMTQADAAFAQAAAAARELGYHSLGLRVAISMARRCRQLGDHRQATSLLRDALSALHEGKETRDQRVARELLAELPV